MMIDEAAMATVQDFGKYLNESMETIIARRMTELVAERDAQIKRLLGADENVVELEAELDVCKKRRNALERDLAAIGALLDAAGVPDGGSTVTRVREEIDRLEAICARLHAALENTTETSCSLADFLEANSGTTELVTVAPAFCKQHWEQVRQVLQIGRNLTGLERATAFDAGFRAGIANQPPNLTVKPRYQTGAELAEWEKGFAYGMTRTDAIASPSGTQRLDVVAGR